MAESPRIACCIAGCRRTFRNKDVGHHVEYLCGKHYRANQGLVVSRKWLKARLKRLAKLLSAKFDKGGISAVECDAVFDRMEKRLDNNWALIRENAQAMQDAGYWAPRPRRKSVKPIPDKGLSSQLDSAFEREFQRAKRAMNAA